jgi:hypothetical protein
MTINRISTATRQGGTASSAAGRERSGTEDRRFQDAVQHMRATPAMPDTCEDGSGKGWSGDGAPSPGVRPVAYNTRHVLDAVAIARLQPAALPERVLGRGQGGVFQPEIAVVGCDIPGDAAVSPTEPLRAFGGLYITEEQYARWKAGIASPEFQENLARALREWEEEATGGIIPASARSVG